jgi:hypothetical protein
LPGSSRIWGLFLDELGIPARTHNPPSSIGDFVGLTAYDITMPAHNPPSSIGDFVGLTAYDIPARLRAIIPLLPGGIPDGLKPAGIPARLRRAYKSP